MNKRRDGVAIALVLALGLTLASALPAAAARHAAQSGPVNINTASQQVLESLPGVGAATAKKIIAGRPYASVADIARAGIAKKTIEKITPLVTVSGAAASAATAPSATTKRIRGARKTVGTQAAASGAIDLNAASQKELESLPGIGAATAKKIIAGRPYASVADLAKAGVRAKTIEKITPLVTVGGAAAAAGSSPAARSSFPWRHSAGTTAATAGAATAGTTAAAAGTTAQVPPAAGMVWVNLSTKVYHYAGDRWYGKTKNGKFMSEQEAIAAGYRAAKTKSSGQQTQTP